jgi:shikimate dehydrogenase
VITARTRTERHPYAELVGDPALARASALIQSYWLHKEGHEAEYRRRRVPPGAIVDCTASLQHYLAERRDDPDWLGCNVTSPLKEVAAALVDRRDAAAARLGTVDLIVRDGSMLVGSNSAAAGFVAPLLRHLPTLRSRRALLVGAGCHARTIAHVLDDLGLALTICNRRLDRAERLVAELGRKDRHRAAALDREAIEQRDIGLVVNATPLGGIGMLRFPFDPDALSAGGLVYDLVCDPTETLLLSTAKRHGFVTIGGFEMLVGQAAASFEALFAKRAPRQFDDVLRMLLVP